MVKKLNIGTKIGVAFGISFAIISTIGIIAYQSTVNLVENIRWQTHAYRVLGELKDLMSQLQSVESAQRGYILTGERRYLEPYYIAIPAINQNIKNLRSLTKDNTNQQLSINSLEPLISQRIDIIQDTIALREKQGLEPARQLVLGDKGKNLMNTIRRIAVEVETQEKRLLDMRSRKTQMATQQANNTIAFGIPFTFLLLSLIGIYLNRNISKPLQDIAKKTTKLADGDLSVSVIEGKRQDEIGVLVQAFNQMVTSLREKTQSNDEQTWLKSNLAKFTQMLQGMRNLQTVAKAILSELTPLVGAQQGVFYLMDMTNNLPILKLIGSYAYQERRNLSNRFQLGEGLVGQCALEKQKILLTDVPSDYIYITSGLGAAKPFNIIVFPIIFENQVTAVIELASFQKFTEIHLTLIDHFSEAIGIVLNAIASNIRTEELLQQSQALATILQNQQDELQQTNQRLEQQTANLYNSEELLKKQQRELKYSNEELQQLNAELEKKAELLELQKQKVEEKNYELEEARKSLEIQASELALSSKYKSEFLANMSHELRTPLNSLLILAKLLTDNSDGNLTSKQVEYSNTIYSAGNDLLSLINDILDLAKIESGTMSLELYPLLFSELKINLQRNFELVAKNKGLKFVLEFSPTLPQSFETDAKRLQQVLKNLLANAFKFTEKGEVRLTINLANQGWNIYSESLNQANAVIAFSVSDTGVGIAPSKQKIIFEAFQQVDGSTSRKYGGTGLGLSISREIARLLGGEITLKSRLGEGSTFTLYIPLICNLDELNFAVASTTQEISKKITPNTQLNILIDSPPNEQTGVGSGVDLNVETSLFLHRIQSLPPVINQQIPAILQPSDTILIDKKLLIIDDDVRNIFAITSLLEGYQMQVLYAENGIEGIEVLQNNPDINIVLMDVMMPEMDGYETTKRIRQQSQFQSLPIIALTAKAMQGDREKCIQAGMSDYITKPVDSEQLLSLLRILLSGVGSGE